MQFKIKYSGDPKTDPSKTGKILKPDFLKIGFQMVGQRNLIQWKARLALTNWKNLFGNQREESLTSLEVCHLLQ